MTCPISLEEEDLEQLACIRDLGPVAMRRLVLHLQELPVEPRRLDALDTIVDEVLNGSPCGLQLLKAAVTVYGWVRQGGYSLAHVLSGLHISLTDSSDWSADELHAWHEVATTFDEFVGLSIVRLSVAAEEMFLENDNVLLRSRLITDIRPIFSESVDQIEGCIVSHQLRLVFRTSGDTKEMTFTLESNDVDSLITQLERGEKKAAVAKNAMSSGIKIPAQIVGEE